MRKIILITMLIGVALLLAASTDHTAQVDPSSGAMKIIESAHSELHGGKHFTYSQIDLDFDIADAVELLIVTPNTTEWTHMIFEVDAAFDTTVSLYEGATHTVAATQTAYNNNRNSASVNATTINTHNNDGVDGTAIFTSSFGINTGVGVNAVLSGGNARGENEWILKQNEKYLLTVVSGTDDSRLSIKLNWYEHTNVY